MPPLRQTYSQPLFLPAFVYTAYVEDPPMSAPLSNVTNETRTRRRITPSQLECLETLFAKSTHPSRDARQRAARDTGMDLKAVTIWLQNKRQALKKATDAPRAPRPAPLRRTMSVPDTRAAHATWSRTSSAPPLLPRISLDAFADRAGRLVDQREDDAHVTTRDSASLWDRMPSSPGEPPSSPSNDMRRLAPLGKRRTMEWACAQDRARMSQSRSQTPAVGVASPTPTRLSVDTEDTLEDDELRTPDASVVCDDLPLGKNSKVTRRDSETADILLMLAGQRL